VRQDWSFERHDRLGFNFRMSPLQSALGLAQLERLDFLVAARCYIARHYEQVLKEEKCEWLVLPHVPEDSTHSYWSYVCKLDETLLGKNWREFRQAFISHGGDGLYSAWKPVHLEPIFQTMAFYGSKEKSPNYDPRYKGAVKSYETGDCPVIEEMQPTLCQFKTSMQTLEKAEQQIEALQKTVRHFA
jgi:perosamine synthetase